MNNNAPVGNITRSNNKPNESTDLVQMETSSHDIDQDIRFSPCRQWPIIFIFFIFL
jgi:hypothetical protein